MSVWRIVFKLFAETLHSILQNFIWRRRVGVLLMASNQQNIRTVSGPQFVIKAHSSVCS